MSASTATDRPADLGPQDYVILALKAHSFPAVLESIQPLLGPDTAVVTAQNGLPWWYFYKHGGEHEDRRIESVDPGGKIWDAIGPERAIGCVVYIAAEIESPGIVRHVEFDRLPLGEPSGEKSERVLALAQRWCRPASAPLSAPTSATTSGSSYGATSPSIRSRR